MVRAGILGYQKMYGSEISLLSLYVILSGRFRGMSERSRNYIRAGLAAFGVIAAGILLWTIIQNWEQFVGMVAQLVRILSPFIYGVVFAYLAAPIYNMVRDGVKLQLGRLFRNHNSRLAESIAKITATVSAVLLIVFVVSGVMMLILPQLIDSIVGIWNSLPTYWTNINEFVQNLLKDNPEAEQVVMDVLNRIYTEIQRWGEDYMRRMDMNRLTDIIIQVSSGVMGIVNLFKNWLIGLIAMVYLLNIKEKLLAQFRKAVYALFRTETANAILDELRFVDQVFGGFIVGKIVDSIIIGFICFVCLQLMRMPYPMLLSAIIGVTNVIPFFGPVIGAIPSAILVLLVSPVKCLYFLLFVLVLQQFDGNILGPRILGNSTGVSSFWVMFSIIFFGGLFGFAGMLLGVPVFAVLSDLLLRFINRRLRKKKLPLEEESYVDVAKIDPHTGQVHSIKEQK